MKPQKNMIEQRLKTTQSAPTQDQETRNDPEFEALVDEITNLIGEGKLPQGFDLENAAKDPALIELMREYGAAAGIRIYAAEQRADEAETNAMERVSERVRQRGALPRSIHGGSTGSRKPPATAERPDSKKHGGKI